jgi:transcriptional regulator with XRE-family HTH domain
LSDWQTTPPSVEAIVSSMATLPGIRRGARGHLYIEEWFETRGLNDEKVGNRIGVDRATVFRWRKEQHRLNPQKIAALAEALDIEPEELWRPPSRRSLDALIKDAPDEVVDMAFDVLKRMAGKRS